MLLTVKCIGVADGRLQAVAGNTNLARVGNDCGLEAHIVTNPGHRGHISNKTLATTYVHLRERRCVVSQRQEQHSLCLGLSGIASRGAIAGDTASCWSSLQRNTAASLPPTPPLHLAKRVRPNVLQGGGFARRDLLGFRKRSPCCQECDGQDEYHDLA